MVGDVMLLLCDTTIHIAINMLLYLWGFPMERGNWIRFLQWIEGLNMVKHGEKPSSESSICGSSWDRNGH